MRSFLDDIDRIATRDYVPSDADVVRARLRTIGVSENRLVFEPPSASDRVEHPLQPSTGPWSSREWIVYDVGGSRTRVRVFPFPVVDNGAHTPGQRQAWLPYFEDLTVVFFLAPLSCFDEKLEEDRSVNRLEDSVALWTAVVSSPLLSRVSDTVTRLTFVFVNICFRRR